MATIKGDSDDDGMEESPLKLVEKTLNAVRLRQRTGSDTISPGLHFKAPIKQTGLVGGRMVGVVSAFRNVDTSGSSSNQQMEVTGFLMNNVTPTQTTDDSQHSSTSEYGSMASDSRLSSPSVSRRVSNLQMENRGSKSNLQISSNRGSKLNSSKSTNLMSGTSLPDLYLQTSTPISNGDSQSWYSTETSNNEILLESENTDHSDDTSTLRRCSAQNMREICPKLLKKLHEQSQPQQQYLRRSMRGRYEIGQWMEDRPLTNTHISLSSPGKPEIKGKGKDQLCWSNNTRKVDSRISTGYYSSTPPSPREDSSTSAISSIHHTDSSIRHIDDDEEEVRPADSQMSCPPRVRYVQRHQHQHRTSGGARSSIRKKRQQAASATSASVAPAKSLPDLTGTTNSKGSVDVQQDITKWNSSGRKNETEDTPLDHGINQKLTSFSSSITVPTDRVELMSTKTTPAPPPLPRKPSALPGRNVDGGIYHCRGVSDSGLIQTSMLDERRTQQQHAEEGNSVSMISRKLFADQIRANSLSSMGTESSSPKIPPKNFRYPSSTTSTSIPTNSQVHDSNFSSSGSSSTRRVVQVHPMCVNAFTHDYSSSDQGQISSSNSSSIGQYSPPDPELSPKSDIKSSAVPPTKPRPPVPKKPAKLTAVSSKSITNQPEPPIRPLKPVNIGKQAKLDCTDEIRKENDFSPISTNGASPFKQRKQLEDEEKYRELSDYVAQRSNDSSLKQILAPNQRSSVEYLEVCFNNGRALGDDSINTSTCGQDGNGSINQPQQVRSFSTDSVDLEKEKFDLIARMSRKLKVLKEEQRAVEEEIGYNNELGATLVAVIEDSDMLDATMKDRFRQFVSDMENITQLLLKLSIQLARVDNEVNRISNGEHTKEKYHHLLDRRRRLMTQLHDAKDLKDGLDERGEQMVSILNPVLSSDQLADYQYFIQMKYKLLLDAREIGDKIKLGEDQKCALELSLSKS